MIYDLEKLIRETKEKYTKISFIECPAFNYEKIYFNRDGFDHLIRKGRKQRTMPDQRRRLRLFRFVPEIIKNQSVTHEYTSSTLNNRIGKFWALKATTEKIKIKIVIRQLGNGRKHFWSVMEE